MTGTDFNGKIIILKGTTVRVRTTNGGDATVVLAANHYPTYDVVTATHVIPSFRITSVEEV